MIKQYLPTPPSKQQTLRGHSARGEGKVVDLAHDDKSAIQFDEVLSGAGLEECGQGLLPQLTEKGGHG
jgi:hypothetical protein